MTQPPAPQQLRQLLTPVRCRPSSRLQWFQRLQPLLNTAHLPPPHLLERLRAAAPQPAAPPSVGAAPGAAAAFEGGASQEVLAAALHCRRSSEAASPLRRPDRSTAARRVRLAAAGSPHWTGSRRLRLLLLSWTPAAAPPSGQGAQRLLPHLCVLSMPPKYIVTFFLNLYFAMSGCRLVNIRPPVRAGLAMIDRQTWVVANTGTEGGRVNASSTKGGKK